MPLADDSCCQGSLPPAPPLTEPALTPLPASSRPRPTPPSGLAPPKPNVTRPGGELAIASSAWGQNGRRVARAASRSRGPGAPVRHDEITSMVTGARTRALRLGRRRPPGGFPRSRRSSAGQGLRRLFRCQSGHRGWLPDCGSSSPIRRRSLSERSPTSTRIGVGNLLTTVGAARIWSAARVGFLSMERRPAEPVEASRDSAADRLLLYLGWRSSLGPSILDDSASGLAASGCRAFLEGRRTGARSVSPNSIDTSRAHSGGRPRCARSSPPARPMASQTGDVAARRAAQSGD
jgi:hypothetical protein